MELQIFIYGVLFGSLFCILVSIVNFFLFKGIEEKTSGKN